MSHKLFAIVSAFLFVVGCTSQQDHTTDSNSVVDDSNSPTVTATDEPTASAEDNAVGRDAPDLTAEHLKSIANAFYEYEKHFGHFPPAASTDAEGKPLLSWRVHILPFLDAYDLYEQFHLGEPWNSDHNLKLIDQMPECYKVIGVVNEGQTSLMVFTGNHAVFGGSNAESRIGPLKPFRKPLISDNQPLERVQQVDAEGNAVVVRPPLRGPTIRDITDGTSNTILAVSAAPERAVPWTKPEDLPFQPENPVAVIGEIPDDGFVTLFWDSRVERLPKDIDHSRLKSLIDSTEFARNGIPQDGEDPPIQ